MKVTVYSSPGCFPCRGTKRDLERYRIPFTDVDVTTDVQAAETVRKLGYQAMPVVVVVLDDGGIDHWTGHRPDQLTALAFLQAEGTA